MSNEKVKNLTYTQTTNPDVLKIANKLSGLEKRKPHDSIRLLILETGQAKIDKLESEKSTREEIKVKV